MKTALTILLSCLFLSTLSAVNSPPPPFAKEVIEKSKTKKLNWKQRLAMRFLKKKLAKLACAKIVLNDGRVLDVDLVEITNEVIKYKRCGKTDDPEFVLNLSDILSIQDAEGVQIYNNIQNTSTTSASVDNPKKTNIFALLSLIFSFFPYVFLVGLVFGIVGLVQINNNKEKYSGKTLAILGIVISSLWIFFLVFLILTFTL